VVRINPPGTGWRCCPREECLALLATRQVGRLGVSNEALPAILPVNFHLLNDRIIVRTVPGTKLDAAVAQAVVAFEVDNYDLEGSWGWSVLVQGVGTEITSRTSRKRSKPCPCGPGRSSTATPTGSWRSTPPW